MNRKSRYIFGDRLNVVLILWFLVLVFLLPVFSQLIHQLDDNEHGHNQMHTHHALNYHHETEKCGIYKFEFSFFNSDATFISVETSAIYVCTYKADYLNQHISNQQYELQLLRAPPVFSKELV